ncbi:hypothetical protein DPMN_186872 [Dreissena polymorpha]|uniref:Uncharacterized protein n=1 Tax=Dreissena polymorpha TaxID=45954 RepID=A0A9D4DMY7_DREPO|nr:hypothetical protein DPMN_186872 [Dreissena polymorpha]
MKVLGVCVAFVAIAVGSDLVIYDSTSQPKCTLVGPRGPRWDCRWHAGLDMEDQIIEEGRIIAYRISWLGFWSGWFVPGFNDLDVRFNVNATTCAVPVKAKSLRRWWTYFYDHHHEFIICRPN